MLLFPFSIFLFVIPLAKITLLFGTAKRLESFLHIANYPVVSARPGSVTFLCRRSRHSLQAKRSKGRAPELRSPTRLSLRDTSHFMLFLCAVATLGSVASYVATYVLMQVESLFRVETLFRPLHWRCFRVETLFRPLRGRTATWGSSPLGRPGGVFIRIGSIAWRCCS